MKRNLKKYNKGGESKKDWISKKIAYLMREESMPQDQAVSVALSLYENKYQIAGEHWNNSSRSEKPRPMGLTNIPNTAQTPMNRLPELSYPNEEANVTDFLNNANQRVFGQQPSTTNTQEKPNPFSNLNRGNFGTISTPRMTSETSPFANLNQGDFGSVETPNSDWTKFQQPTSLQKDEEKTQDEKTRFFNPYATFDIPSSAYMFGQSLQNKDAFGAVASGLKMATGLGRNIAAGVGFANRNNQVMQTASENFREDSLPRWQTLPSHQEGGVAGNMTQLIYAYALMVGEDPQQLLEEISSLPPSLQERRLKSIQNKVQMPVLQDGGEMSKILTGEYIAETGNPEDFVAELEVDEFVKTPQGDISKVLGETHEQGGVKVTEEQLPEGSKIISDHLKIGKDKAKQLAEKYDLKLKPTHTFADVVDMYSKKIGLADLIEEEEGVIKTLETQTKKLVDLGGEDNTIALNTNFLQKRLNEIAQEKQAKEKDKEVIFDEVFNLQEQSKGNNTTADMFQQGGVFNQDIIAEYAKKHNVPLERAMQLVNQFRYGGINEYQGGGERQDRLDEFYRHIVGLGYTGAKQIGEMQNWMSENYPEQVSSYFLESGQPLTAKHVDLLKQTYPWAFKYSGISPDKDSASYTNEEKQKLFAQVKGKGDGSGDDGLTTGEMNTFLLNGFKDNKWDWRFPMVSSSPNMGADPKGLQFAPLPEIPMQNVNEILVDEAGVPIETEEEKKRRLNLLLFPDQSPLFPLAMQPALKIERTFDRVDAPMMTYEPMVEQIRRQEQAAMEAINSLPDAQRAAAIAQIQANTQNELNKVMTNVATQNQQTQFNTRNQNAQIQHMEENARATDALNYEGRILTAAAKTEANLRNYYNQMQKINLANYNAVNQANLLNDLYPNMQFTGQGVEEFNPATISYGRMSQPTTPQKKEKPKAKKGGRFKKANY